MAEELTEVVAEAAEAVAEQATSVAEVSRAFTNRDLTLVGVGLGIGAGIGFAAGYFSLKKRLSLKYYAYAEQEIEETREHLRKVEDELRQGVRDTLHSLGSPVFRQKPSLDEVVQDLGYAEVDEPKRYTAEEWQAIYEASEAELVKNDKRIEAGLAELRKSEDEAAEAPVVRNVFEGVEPDSEWDYEAEKSQRTPHQPYIIHVDEFREREGGYDQITVTYFVGDNVLCDDRDQAMDQVDETVGLENLQHFGHGSKDPNLLYIRNEDLGVEFEVLRSDGKYAHEVHGQSLEHSQPRRTMGRRQRFDDE